jgi:SAM-dependent methyltransferase
MATDQEDSWAAYYRHLYSEAPPSWLDLSNEAVQAQTFALAIEAAGPIEGRRCLDVGCGYGQLSTGLHGLRAGEVVGVDFIAEAIASCRERFPEIRWECGSASNEAFVRSLGDFDLIFLVEVLQYVGWESTLRTLWDRVRGGGRLVAVVPNRGNPIVQKTMARFPGMYLPPNPAELDALVASLPDVEHWARRGMGFQEDQRLVPYFAYTWATDGETRDPTNRLVFVIVKRDELRVRREPSQHP